MEGVTGSNPVPPTIDVPSEARGVGPEIYFGQRNDERFRVLAGLDQDADEA